MEIRDLLLLAEDHNHEILSFPLKESPSLSIEDSTGQCHVAMSEGLSEPNRKVQLAHELGHCEYGGFYNYHSPYEIRSRAENRANRWAFLHTLPLQEIQEGIRSGENIWELADRFNVTPEFMRAGLKFYIEQLGLTL